MATFTEIAGHNARILIDGFVYQFQTCRITYTVGEGNTTNSEGGGFYEHINTVVSIEVEIVGASFDFANNPFGVPVLIAGGTTHNLSILPHKAVPGTAWNISMFKVLSVEHAIDANNLQPVTIRGKATGSFDIPLVVAP